MKETTRAGINILGQTGEIYDISSLGGTDVFSKRESKGVYLVVGTYGMVPYPPVNVGWGYTLNRVDDRADVDITYYEETEILRVECTKNGQPYDLTHMITLHVLVPALVLPDLPTE
jgi:hypothetical protein